MLTVSVSAKRNVQVRGVRVFRLRIPTVLGTSPDSNRDHVCDWANTV